MTVNKTKPSTLSVDEWLMTLKLDKRQDAKDMINLMQDITKEPPVIWGNDMIGFGNVHLIYPSGREIDYFILGFGMRKNGLTIYLSIEVNKKVFEELGKHKKGVGCLYINKLSDVNQEELKKIMVESVNHLKLAI